MLAILERAVKTSIGGLVERMARSSCPCFVPPEKIAYCTPKSDMEYIFREMKRFHVKLVRIQKEYKDRNTEYNIYTQSSRDAVHLRKVQHNHTW